MNGKIRGNDTVDATFEDAVEVYKDLPKKAKDSQKVVAYTLTPISMFCEKQEAILNSITQQNIALVKVIAT